MPRGVHDAAALGFARSADAYDRARPEYPPDAIAWLAERMGLRAGRTVVDLAAGTGKLTRPLATTGAETIAIEPLAEMRARIGPAAAQVVDGTAEAMPLPDASADAVTVGQAFHWFDGPAALAEIHRVLRPGGTLALVWNRRPLENPVHAAIERIIAPYHRDAPRHRSGAWRAVLRRDGAVRAARRAHVRARAPARRRRARRPGRLDELHRRARRRARGRRSSRRSARSPPTGRSSFPYVCEVFVCDRCP